MSQVTAHGQLSEMVQYHEFSEGFWAEGVATQHSWPSCMTSEARNGSEVQLRF